MKQARVEPQLKPGHFLHWQGQTYRVLPRNGAEPLTLYLENVVTAEQYSLRMEELLLDSGGDEELAFAPTLATLQHQLEHQHQLSKPMVIHPDGLPTKLLQKADHIVAVVETVEQLVTAEEGRAQLRNGSKFKRTPAIRRACAQLADPVKPATFYKYRRLYRQAGGDRARIGANLRRSSFNQSRMDQAQLHFIDTHILRFYARGRLLRLQPQQVYQIAQSTLNRTTGLWVDP